MQYTSFISSFVLLASLFPVSSFLIMSTQSNIRLPPGPYPGDSVIPDAVMVYDQTKIVNASTAIIWPWYVSLNDRGLHPLTV